jgi:hypothetical protein
MHSQSCHVEQKLLTSPVFSEVRITGSVVFCVIFCRLFFNLLSIVLSVLRYTPSDYPFGIMKLFFSVNMLKVHCY